MLGDSGDTLEALLRLIEMTVPVQRIWLDSTESLSESGPSRPALAPIDEVIPVAEQIVKAMQRAGGISPQAAVKAVLREEPFSSYPALAQLLGAH